MIRIIPSTGNKGFMYSPFILIVLVVLSSGLAVHFTRTETIRVEGMRLEAAVVKAVLDMEEMKSNLNTIAWFSSCQPTSAKENKTIEEIREEIERNLNEYAGNYKPAEISTIEGEYSISLEELPNGYLLLKTIKAPRACISKSAILLCSNLSIERLVDRKCSH